IRRERQRVPRPPARTRRGAHPARGVRSATDSCVGMGHGGGSTEADLAHGGASCRVFLRARGWKNVLRGRRAVAVACGARRADWGGVCACRGGGVETVTVVLRDVNEVDVNAWLCRALGLAQHEDAFPWQKDLLGRFRRGEIPDCPRYSNRPRQDVPE